MHSFTQDVICVTYLLLSETMHLLQVQPGRGGRREAFKIIITESMLRELQQQARVTTSDFPSVHQKPADATKPCGEKCPISLCKSEAPF